MISGPRQDTTASFSQTCLIRVGDTEEMGTVKLCLMAAVGYDHRKAETPRDLVSGIVPLSHFSFCMGWGLLSCDLQDGP